MFTVNSANTLVPLGESETTGQNQQSVTTAVLANEPILIWVYGYNFAQGYYSLTFQLS